MKKTIWKMMVSLLIVFIVSQPIFQLLGINNNVYAKQRFMTGTLEKIKNSLHSGETYEVESTRKNYRVLHVGTLVLKDVPACLVQWFESGKTLSTNRSGLFATVTGVDKDEQSKKSHYVSQYEVHNKEKYYNLTVHIQLLYVTPNKYDSKLVPGCFPEITVSGSYGQINPIKFKDVPLKVYTYQALDNYYGADEYSVKINMPDSISSAAVVNSGIVQQIVNTVQNNYYSYDYTDYYEDDYSYEESYDEPYEEPEDIIEFNDDEKRLYISTMYRRVLKRGPSAQDVEDNMGKTPREIASDLIFSSESNTKNNINNISNQEFIKCCYRFLLGREADAEGLNAHTRNLNNTNDRGKALKAFLKEEFINTRTKPISRIEIGEGTCDAVCNNLLNQGFEVYKCDSKSILMFNEQIGKVSSLDLSGKSLTNLNGLSVFTNLTKLVAQNNKITDVTGIQKLTKLTYLNLNNNSINKNITPIFNLTNLTELYLDNNGLTSDYISNISKLTKLQKLSIKNNNIINISALSGIGSLKELYADNNKISDISNIKVEKLSLKNQVIEESGYSSQSDMFGMATLAKTKNSLVYTDQDLVYKDCKTENGKIVLNADASKGVVTIKGGAADGTTCTYTNYLKRIEINDKVLADRLQPKLGELVIERRDANGKYNIYVNANKAKLIQNLDLSANAKDSSQITDITGLENFENLKTLNLTNNKVSNLDKLSVLSNLDSLTIKNNGLTNLNSVKNLKSLKQLDASNNEITDITGLSGLTNLDTVILNSNKIGNNLAPLNNLSNLSVLSLSDNGISNLQSIKSLKLSKLYASYNFLSDFTTVKNDGKNAIQAMNNIVDLEIEGTECNIPDIVKIAMENNGGVDCLELTKCAIKDDKVVLGELTRNAQIKIIKGELSDTIINIKNEKYITSPITKTAYKNVEEGVKVTITIDRPIYNIWGWTREDDTYTKYSKVYKYNVANEKVAIVDGYGNSSQIIINIDSIQNARVPDLKVSYSETAPTKGDVIVTISSSARLKDPEKSGWKLSDDRKSITCTFTENKHNGKNIFLESNPSAFTSDDYDANVKINVDNIDKTAPICSVEYSQTNVTKSSVVATIWGDEDIQLVDKNSKFINKTAKQNGKGETIYGLSLLYSKNTNESLTVKDAAGNTKTVNISINNIDNKIDGLNATSSGVTATNQNQMITINANEKISISTVNVNIARKGLNLANKFYENETDLPILRVATTVPVMLLAETEINTEESDNEISIEVTEGDYGVLSIADNTGNAELVMYNSSNVDKTAPIISLEKQERQNDGSLLVTLLANEKIQNTEDIDGWLLSEDGLRLTKTFKSNKNETIKVKDLAGNEGVLDLEITDVNAIPYTIDYEPIENTDSVLVIISADRELEPVDGWQLLEDKKSIAKALNISESETVKIEDSEGYGSEVEVVAFNSLEKETQKTDDTQTTEVIPQTGKYTAFVVIFSSILTILTVLVIFNYQKNYNKE